MLQSYFLIGLAVFCGFFVQTVLGFAATVISVPILLYFFADQTSCVIYVNIPLVF